MEQLIKEMSQKLKEKDKIIAETVKKANIKDTFKTLKKKQLLTGSIAEINVQTTQPLNMTNQVKHESTLSPRLSKKTMDLKQV